MCHSSCGIKLSHLPSTSWIDHPSHPTPRREIAKMPTSTAPPRSTPQEVLRFTNCLALQPDGTLPSDPTTYSLHVDPASGHIIDGQSAFFDSKTAFTSTIDLEGDYLVPGFIDVQINGGYGVDFSEFSEGQEETYLAGLDEFAKRILETGVTSFVPTIITQHSEKYRQVSTPLPFFLTVLLKVFTTDQSTTL